MAVAKLPDLKGGASKMNYPAAELRGILLIKKTNEIVFQWSRLWLWDSKEIFLHSFHNIFPDLIDIFSQTTKPVSRNFGGFLLKVELMYCRSIGQIGGF